MTGNMDKISGLKKNDDIELDIEGFTSEGSGVGHYNGQAVFVSGAAAGDRIECHIIKAKKNYAIGKISSILKASQDRIIPDCPVFPACGGCQYRHILYEAEKQLKTRKVADAFKRIGHLDIVPSDTVGADAPDRYRNKAQYPVQITDGKLTAGFYAPFSHRVTDCRDCLLHPEEFRTVLDATASWIKNNKVTSYDEKTGNGLLRHIYIRKAFGTDEIMVCLIINGSSIPAQDEFIKKITSKIPAVKTIVLNTNREKTNVITGKKCTVIYGKGYIEDILCGKRFRISPLSFYQVNHAQAQKLYAQATEFAITDKTETVLDMYCGAGTIGLSMSDKVKNLIGVEIVPEAIEDAKINAKLNNVNNARFICADASEAAEKLKKEGIRPDTVILDPPRKGCDEALLHTVNSMSPERIVYISCDPATLARDCAVLDTLGYHVREAVPFDLFPRTVHVETAALLTK